MADELDFFSVINADSSAHLVATNSRASKNGGTPIPLSDLSNKVIMKVLHTRTEIKIYPNGSVFQKSQSWFEDKHYEVKPKPKKELVKAKQVELQKKEEY